MKKLKSFSSVTVLWCVSYFLLLAVFVFSTAVMFGLNRSVINKINSRYCQTILEEINENAIQEINKTRDMYSAIVNFPDIDNILAIGSFDGYYSSKAVLTLLKDLSVIKGDKDFYIYIPHTDTVLLQGSYYRSETYYKAALSDISMTYDEWMEKFHKNSRLELDSFTDAKNGEIVFREKYMGRDGKELVLIITVSDSQILNKVKLPQWAAESDIYISTLNGNIYMSSINSGIGKKVKNVQDLRLAYGNDRKIVEKTTYTSIPMIVTIAYPSHSAWVEVSILNRMQSILFIILLCFSVAIITFSVKRNYRPISSILDKLNISGSKNEYSDIEKGITELVDKYKFYVKQTEQFGREHMRNILSSCLTGNYSEEYTLKLMEENDIKFPVDSFALCGFEVHDVTTLFGRFDSKNVPREQKFKELTIILDNIFTEIFDEKGIVVKITPVNEEIFMIANTDEKNYISGVIFEILTRGIRLIKEHFFVDVSFVLTEFYDGMGKLSVAYNRARYLLQYKEIMQIAEPISVKDIQIGQGSALAALFDAETEGKLIKNITLGNYEGAENQINYIFSELSAINPTLEQIRCFMIDLGCMLYKIPQQQIEIDYDKILENSRRSSSMRQFILETVKEICEKGHNVTTKVDKVAEIKMYVDRNYAQAMDLNSVAILFDLSTSYLSRHFKKVAGMSLPDYINKTRLLHAKDMLKNTNKPIKDIATAVGYENLRSFNRVFQKYEQIPPSHWRNSNK